MPDMAKQTSRSKGASPTRTALREPAWIAADRSHCGSARVLLLTDRWMCSPHRTCGLQRPLPVGPAPPGLVRRLAAIGAGAFPLWAFRGFGPGRSQGSRCCGSASSATITWMWSGCWVSVRTSRQFWAPSSPRTEWWADCVCALQAMNGRSPVVCWPRCPAEPDPPSARGPPGDDRLVVRSQVPGAGGCSSPTAARTAEPAGRRS
jgi:hypothetical protein